MKTLLFITALLVATVTQAQDFKIGPKAGLGYSSFNSYEGDENYSNYQIGAQAYLGLGSKIALSPELNFSKHIYYGENFRPSVSYINVPVVVRYFVASGFNIHAGPEIGFLVDDNFPDIYFEDGFAFEDLNVSATVGAGYRFDLGLTLDLRYTTGLTDVSNFEGDKLSTFSLSVGYLF